MVFRAVTPTKVKIIVLKNVFSFFGFPFGNCKSLVYLTFDFDLVIPGHSDG